MSTSLAMINLLEANETIFFSHWQGELCQWIELRLENTTQAEVDAEVAIMTGGKSAKTALRVMPGEGRYRA